MTAHTPVQEHTLLPEINRVSFPWMHNDYQAWPHVVLAYWSFNITAMFLKPHNQFKCTPGALIPFEPLQQPFLGSRVTPWCRGIDWKLPCCPRIEFHPGNFSRVIPSLLWVAFFSQPEAKILGIIVTGAEYSIKLPYSFLWSFCWWGGFSLAGKPDILASQQQHTHPPCSSILSPS